MKRLAAYLSVFLLTLVLPLGSHAAEPVLKNVDPSAAEALIKEKKVVVLDVRTPGEYKSGHIQGATNVDFQSKDFEKKLSELDKSKAYLVHCAVGGRSSKAVARMKEMDFKTIYHLDSGMKGWEKAGKPVVKDGGK